MDVQGYGFSPVLHGLLWLDGTGGQEDELDDVARGKLQPPPDKEIGEVDRIGGQDSLAEMERKAGIKLPN